MPLPLTSLLRALSWVLSAARQRRGLKAMPLPLSVVMVLPLEAALGAYGCCCCRMGRAAGPWWRKVLLCCCCCCCCTAVSGARAVGICWVSGGSAVACCDGLPVLPEGQATRCLCATWPLSTCCKTGTPRPASAAAIQGSTVAPAGLCPWPAGEVEEAAAAANPASDIGTLGAAIRAFTTC